MALLNRGCSLVFKKNFYVFAESAKTLKKEIIIPACTLCDLGGSAVRFSIAGKGEDGIQCRQELLWRLVADDMLDLRAVRSHEEKVWNPDPAVLLSQSVVFLGDFALLVNVDAHGNECRNFCFDFGVCECLLFHFLARWAP